MPKVSVIVPIYRAEKYLSRCIDSILAQSFSDFELILVDDGSPDNCGKICDEYAAQDSRIRVIHQENAGVSAARNAGLDAAVGTYIMFCDSDDWVEPDWCECLYKGIRAEHAVLAICGNKVIKNGNVIHSSNYMNETVQLHDLLGQWIPRVPWNKIFINKVIKTNNIKFRQDCAYGEDVRFFLDYISMFNGDRLCTTLGNICYNYRFLEGSLSHKYIQNFWEKETELLAITITVSNQLGMNRRKYEKKVNQMYYDLITRGIKNLFLHDNPMNLCEKYIRLKEILYSEELTLCLKAEGAKSWPFWYFFLLKYRIMPLLFCYHVLHK